MRTGGLSPKQKAIASKAPPPNKITGADFAVLKKEKAKGRGMGLQDEKIKPGKVMKARDGKAIKKDPTKPVNPFQKTPKTTSKLPGRIGTALGIGAMMVPAAYAAAKQYKDYKSAKNRDKAKVKKYNKGGGADMAKKYPRSKKYITLPEMKQHRKDVYKGMAQYSVGGGADLGKKGIIKGINANLQDKAERRLNVPDRTDIKKQKASVTKLKEQARRSRLETMKDRQTGRPVYERMGGGMMQRPMGYKKGTMVKARGCKLGRTRPTKIT